MEDKLYKTDRINGNFIIALAKSMQATHKRSVELFHQYHITFSQFSALEALYHKGALTINQLIEVMLSSSGNMTVIVKNLEKQGWILRKENPKDKRSYLIELSENGRELMEEVFPKHMKLLEESLSILSQEEKLEVIQTLKKLKS